MGCDKDWDSFTDIDCGNEVTATSAFCWYQFALPAARLGLSLRGTVAKALQRLYSPFHQSPRARTLPFRLPVHRIRGANATTKHQRLDKHHYPRHCQKPCIQKPQRSGKSGTIMVLNAPGTEQTLGNTRLSLISSIPFFVDFGVPTTRAPGRPLR
jgi:hypothetical protein